MDRPTLDSESPPRTDKQQFLAVAALILCSLFWGYSFPTMQLGTTAFDRHALAVNPNNAHVIAARIAFNGVRFALAAMLYALLIIPQLRRFNRAEVVGGILVGLFYGGGMLFQTTGLRWTLPSVSGFLTALAVVFAPLAQALILRRRVGPATWCAIAVAMVGMVLLSWPNPGAHADNTQIIPPPVKYLGEIFTTLASLLFTGQILTVDRFGQRASAARLTLVMLATTSLASLLGALALGGVRWGPALTACATDRTLLWTLATLVVISSVAAMHLMNQYQPFVSPAIASVVYCTEPIFATMFSIAFKTEKLTGLTIAGGLTVFASVLIVAWAVNSARNSKPDSA